jgi:hypothetical protein
MDPKKEVPDEPERDEDTDTEQLMLDLGGNG